MTRDRRFFFKLLGTVLLAVLSLPMVSACYCQEEETLPPTSRCEATTGGTSVRALEVFRTIDTDAGEPDFANPALNPGDGLPVVGGFQGASMVTPRLRFPAFDDPEPEDTERCMQTTYSGLTMSFTRDLIFVRRGEYWVYEYAVSDPIDGSDTFTLSVVAEDSAVTASVEIQLAVGL